MNIASLEEQFLLLQRCHPQIEWLKEERDRGFQSFKAKGFPAVKDEAWRFTNISPIKKTDFSLPKPREKQLVIDDAVDQLSFQGMKCVRLVFVNGTYVPKYSANIPANAKVGLFSTLEQDVQQRVQKKFGYAIQTVDSFTALNTALMQDIAVILIPDNTEIKLPIHMLYLTTDSKEKTITSPRNFIMIGDNATASIVESYAGLGSNVYFTNSVTEVFLGKDSSLDYCKMQRESRDSFHIGSLHVQARGIFRSTSINLGGKLARNMIDVNLDAEHIECTLNGLYLGTGKQCIDNHTNIDHRHPNCQSYELYKGILGEKASGVFNGKIYVHPQAQKTDAKQTNRALLLSDNAKINTKPELEIYADDVKCTHGATVGQLDQEALFYLRSRGLTEKQARSMLVYGFAEEALTGLKIKEIRQEMDQILGEKFRSSPKSDERS